MKHCYRCGECKDDYRFRPITRTVQMVHPVRAVASR
ncbi:protein NinD [Salmonella enterica subsp. enterica serovar Dublin]